MLIFGCLAATAVYVDIYMYAGKPVSAEPVKQVVIVEPGQKFNSLSRILHQKGVIRHPAKFRFFPESKAMINT